MNSVLIVDDDPDLLEMVCLLLRSHKLNVSCIRDGASFLTAITENKPDVVLMDISLGDADGRKLCHELKSMEAFAHIPVILYSAAEIPSNTVKESKADDFLTKPFDNRQLVKKIKALM